MKLVCAPTGYPFPEAGDELKVLLFGHAPQADQATVGDVGAAIKNEILRQRIDAAQRAWDLLSLALSVTAADLAGHRNASADGWTREFDIEVSVAAPEFWNAQKNRVQGMLGFLTTDRWRVNFTSGGFVPHVAGELVHPKEDCVTLLSGGLDSLVGAIDLVSQGKRPYAVSHIVTGDAEKQRIFAQSIGGGLRHLQLNHNVRVPQSEMPPSQRARSLIFIAYGVLVATSLALYHDGGDVPVYLCENGFISVNPPLTGSRVGSLSTRTTHPVFLAEVQQLLLAAGLRIRLENPYQLKTKGEMLRECSNRPLLRQHAASTTSCGRFGRFGFKHCGRCLPCLVRRAAFRAAKIKDTTAYHYAALGQDDADHAGFDDVRSVAMALAEAKAVGAEAWAGRSLSTSLTANVADLQAMVARGLKELHSLLKFHDVK